MNFRIGFGFDIHQLKEDYPFFLGGINIPHYKGALGHSDADVLIHSICDALLGAANLRDIGFHFPDSSDDYKGIDSKILLKNTVELLKSKNFAVVNIDSTICLQKPKIKDYIPDMQNILAEILEIDADLISIKSTTTEGLGFVGKEEGIACYAVVLIEKLKVYKVKSS